MKRAAWLTDIHLNFISFIELVTFVDNVLKEQPDAIIISGDIGEADTVVSYLTELEKLLQKEIFFVLGNHDYYRGSIERVRHDVRIASRHSRHLRWLPDIGIAELTPAVALIGHGSWPDGRLGDWQRSNLLLNDYFYIKEFNQSVRIEGYDSTKFFKPDPALASALRGQDAKRERLEKMQVLADEAAQYIAGVLPRALESYRQVVVVTHAPPFREASWYDGQVSDDIWAPHFSCKAMGDVLRREMESRPHNQMTVLCGHTHGRGEAHILDNLRVLTGGATYGNPSVQRLFVFE